MQEKVVYLTPEGRERFASELEELVTVRRREIEERLRRAREFADSLDASEYDEARDEQAFVEGRILELERLLRTAQMIHEPARGDYVRMGCRVTVRDADGEEQTYQLVGSREAAPRKGLISNESPIGRALLGKRVGDETTIVAPGGSFTVTLISIQ